MIHELIEEVTKRHPKLVEQEKERLFRDAIGAWTRQILRSDSDSLRSSQLILPMELRHIRLPVCIPVWPKGQQGGEAEWIEPPDITFAQLDQEIARKLELSVARDLRNLQIVREYLAPHMADQPHKKIGPVLKRLAAEEARKKKEG